jgi:hypothetical protein
MKNSKKGSAALILLIIAIIIIGGGVYYYSTTHPAASNSPIRLLSTEIPAKGSDMIEGSIQYDCQPEFFDPKITKYNRATDVDGNQRYKIANDEYPTFNINGWNDEGENKITLATPYKLTNYVFGCASTFSSAVEITKDGVRQGLYTHINNWLTQSSVSADKKSIFIANNVKNSNGTWEKMRRIINIEANTKIKLPNMTCASDKGLWSGNKLMTYTDYSRGYEQPGHKTQVCIWDTQGKLLNQLEAELYWQGANDIGLIDQIGILPNDPNIFYTYSHLSRVYPKTGEVCYLHFQDMTNQNRYKKIKISEGSEEILSCPMVTFNFQGITFDSQKVPFTVDNNQLR